MKVYILTFLLISFNLLAKSGKEIGNGGDVLVCPEKNYLLDYYEGEKRWELPVDLGAADLPVLDKVKLALNRLDPIKRKLLLSWLDKFFEQAKFVPQLADIPDSGVAYWPRECKLIQGAVNQEPLLPDDAHYMISKKAYDLLDNDHKAGLILHELMYREAKSRFKICYERTDDRSKCPSLHANSKLVRYFNAMVSSGKYEDLTTHQKIDLHMKMKMPIVNVNNFVLYTLEKNISDKKPFSFYYNSLRNSYLSKEDYLYFLKGKVFSFNDKETGREWLKNGKVGITHFTNGVLQLSGDDYDVNTTVHFSYPMENISSVSRYRFDKVLKFNFQLNEKSKVEYNILEMGIDGNTVYELKTVSKSSFMIKNNLKINYDKEAQLEKEVDVLQGRARLVLDYGTSDSWFLPFRHEKLVENKKGEAEVQLCLKNKLGHKELCMREGYLKYALRDILLNPINQYSSQVFPSSGSEVFLGRSKSLNFVSSKMSTSEIKKEVSSMKHKLLRSCKLMLKGYLQTNEQLEDQLFCNVRDSSSGNNDYGYVYLESKIVSISDSVYNRLKGKIRMHFNSKQKKGFLVSYERAKKLAISKALKKCKKSIAKYKDELGCFAPEENCLYHHNEKAWTCRATANLNQLRYVD